MWSLSGQTHEPAQKQHYLQSTIQNVDTVREGTNTRSPAEAPTRQPAQAGPRRFRQPLAPRQHVAPPNPQLPQAAPANAAQRGGTGRGGAKWGGEETPPAPAAHRAAHAAPARRRAGGKSRPAGGAWASSRRAAPRCRYIPELEVRGPSG